MTKTIIDKSTSLLKNKWVTLTILFSMMILSLLYSDEISHSVRSGLSICASVIIPSVFPFIIFSDFLHSTVDFSSLKYLGALFEKTFKINRTGLCPFLLGILCGFPLGVKSAAELYRNGRLSKDEAERLIGFSNNTGPAFLVSGIGLGLRGYIEDGIVLYITMVLSSIMVGFIFSLKSKANLSREYSIKTHNFSLTSSIKNAGFNTLTICSFLTFFACFCGLLRKMLGESYLYLIIIPFLEVGSATSILSKTALLTERISLTLSAFAVSFSGFSVHMQALSFLCDTDIGYSKYFLMKFFQGIIAAALTYFIYPILLI